MMSSSKRIVLDTNQLISAGTAWTDILSEVKPNEARRLLKAVIREHTGLYSGDILAEYVEKLLEKGPKGRAATLIGLIIGAFEFVLVVSTTCDPAPGDPDDIVFLLCAIDGNADFLVSNDGDLLSLKESYSKPSIINPDEAKSIF